MISPWQKRAALAWAIASAAIGLSEWLIVMVLDGATIPSLVGKLLLLCLAIGNLAPYVLLAVVAVLAFELAPSRLATRLRKPWQALALAGGAAFVLALPYAVPLGRYTFSGPAARNLAHHGLLVTAAVVLAAGSFAALALLVASGLLKRHRGVGLALSLLGCFGFLWLSRTTLADEYEPLHAFLAIQSVGFAGLLGSLAAAGSAVSSARRSWAALALVLCSVLGAAVIAGRVPSVAWVLWSRTGASRYITERITLLEPRVAFDGSNAKMVVKPRLENELSLARRRERAAAQAPNIVIFSVDGLRPDHVGAYGYKKNPTTPNIDRFAARGVRFLNAYSSYPQTAYFNSALLLGRYVPWMARKHEVPAAFKKQAITRLLHARDYHVLVKAWFEHSSHNTFRPAEYEIDTHLKKSRSKSDLEDPLEERLPLFERHLKEARQANKPAFLWMHLLGTHPVKGKFVPDPAFRFGKSRFDQYDSAIAGSDRWLEHIEKLVARETDPTRPTIWIICSDHGVRIEEEGRTLYSSIVRVPLIIVAPTLKPSVRIEPIDTSLDLAATVLDFAGITPPESYDGISLLPLLEVGDPEGHMAKRLIPLKRARWRGAIYGPFKLLQYGESASLVNTTDDPDEQRNLIGEYQGLARLMKERAAVELDRRTESMMQGLKASGEDEEADDE